MSDPNEPWMEMGECKGMDPNVFFLERGDQVGIDKAKTICKPCVVRKKCLDYAIETGQDDGIWGGAASGDFRKARRARREAA